MSQPMIDMLMGKPQGQSPVFGAQSPLVAPYPMMPQQTNLPQATADMNLSPQEQALYMRHVTNLYGPGGVDNSPTPEEPQGSRSTLYASVQQGPDGKYYTVPTVWDGNIQTQRIQTSRGQFDVPNQQALQNVAQTGWNNFPSNTDPNLAASRYQQMHNYMDKDTAAYNAMSPVFQPQQSPVFGGNSL